MNLPKFVVLFEKAQHAMGEMRRKSNYTRQKGKRTDKNYEVLEVLLYLTFKKLDFFLLVDL